MNRPNGRNRRPISSHPTGHGPERIVAGRQLWDQVMEAIDRLPPQAARPPHLRFVYTTAAMRRRTSPGSSPRW
jgi:hypothetical protein